MSDIEGPQISGSPTLEEQRAILAALYKMLREQREAAKPSAWKMAGRAISTRSGILDYRKRMGGPGWTHSGTLAWTGQVYRGRHGRGDAK